METIGIICEYNPFHNGHVYHIKKIKERYPDSLIVLIMSGYFTERGDISIISKYDKTRIALKNDVDLVLELPALYTINSADYFGYASVKALSYANVDRIIFGSETCDVELLKSAALKQLDDSFNTNIKEELAKGINYPTALSKALNMEFKSNDLLGISYIKAIEKDSLNIEIETIKRTNDFLDKELDSDIISAENIRSRLKNKEDIKKYIPDYDIKVINELDEDKLFLLLKYKIMTIDNLDEYLGVDEGLAPKIKKVILSSSSYEDMILKLKSKRYTYVRLKRMLAHILLGIKKEDMNNKLNCIRILGFTQKGQKYLKENKLEHLVYKYDDRIREIEMQASYLYDELMHTETFKEEILNKPIKEE